MANNENSRSGGPGRTSNEGRKEASGGEKNPVSGATTGNGGGQDSTSRGGGSDRSAASKGGGKPRKGSSVPSQKGK